MAVGLRRRGVDVLTSQEAPMLSAADVDQLALATRVHCVLLTQDDDSLRLHAAGHGHAGIICAHRQTPIGNRIRGAMLIIDVLAPADMADHVEFV